VAPGGIQGALRWVVGKGAAYFSSGRVSNMTLVLQESTDPPVSDGESVATITK